MRGRGKRSPEDAGVAPCKNRGTPSDTAAPEVGHAARRARLFACALLVLVAQHAQALLPVEHWQTQRGARVYFVQNRDLPMLDISVDFPAGAAFDPQSKAGVASMTARLLTLGAEGMSEDDISRRIADVGAQLSHRFDLDRAGLGLRTLSAPSERSRALEILARVLTRPAFDAKVLEREKVRVIGRLKDADTRPDTIASRTFSRMAYPDHPYGRRAAGEVPTVAVLTREDLAAFYRSHYVAQRAVIAIMGDITREEAAAVAESLSAELPTHDAAAPVLPQVVSLEESRVQRIEHPAKQSHIIMGAPGIRRDDPDYFPLYVGNHVLGGGGFSSRITEEVRTRRGLAYSAYSYFSPMLERGPFAVGMQTQASQVDEALEVVRRTLTEFVAKGPTAKELAAAKRNIIGGFPLRIDSNRKIHENLALIGFYGLPLDYLDEFTRKVERVTAAQIRAAFQRHVDPARLVTVVVGPADQKAAGREPSATRVMP